MKETIYDYVKRNESSYQTPVELEEGWSWSMKEHLRHSFLIKNSQFLEENENRYLRPNKNIVLAISNIAYRSEGFDVKDIDIYVNNIDENYKSLIVRKYYEKWALENALDTFIDDVVQSYHDYGGTLVRDTNQGRPEVIDLRTLAFCNQKNIMDNPFCIKHEYSPSQLREWEGVWGKDSNGASIDIEDFIVLCKDEPTMVIYELVGVLPSEWLDNEEGEIMDTQQLQVIAYYKREDKKEVGVTLFKKKMPKLPFKFLPRDKIVGRALGRGGIEELFEEQTWTNWNEIKITEMLEGASKMVNLTDDPAFVSSHPSGLKGVENHEVLKVGAGTKGVWQMDTTPRNISVFNDALDRWENSGRVKGSASEGMLSEPSPSGTPFKLFEAQTMLSQGMHKFRQGQIATFIDEIHRDWILEHVVQDINDDHDFLSELSVDEMQYVAKNVATQQWNDNTKNTILSGQIADPNEKDVFIQKTISEYMSAGNKKFISIVKGELKDIPLEIKTNVMGKQKNLAMMTDKLTNVLRQFLATPQLRQDPEMIKLLNVILESSGMSPIMFGATPSQPQLQPGQPGQPNQPNQAPAMAMAQQNVQ